MNLFALSDSETVKAKEFTKKHGYIQFILTPNPIGVKVEVLCRQCEKREDITEYDRWQ